MPATSRPDVTLTEAAEIAAAIRLVRAARDRIANQGFGHALGGEAYRLGQLAHSLEMADDQLYDVLNTANAYLSCTASAEAIDSLRHRPKLRPVS